LMNILPCLVGDLTDAAKQKAQTRIMQKLGINSVCIEILSFLLSPTVQ
jgi:hypothetical protein